MCSVIYRFGSARGAPRKEVSFLKVNEYVQIYLENYTFNRQ